jgi:two-component system, sensor histidine kinase
MNQNKLKILIVEDNEINQIIIQTILKKLNCECTVASDGSIAVEICRKDSFDVIFMDLQMPVMDGYLATEKLRNELNLTIPIYAVTADAYPEDMAHCDAVGMTGVILKPYKQDQLSEIINNLQLSV